MNRLDSLRTETMRELKSQLKLCEKDLVTLSRERDGLRADIDLPAHFLITATGMVKRLHKEISRIRRVINEKKPLGWLPRPGAFLVSQPTIYRVPLFVDKQVAHVNIQSFGDPSQPDK